MKFRIALFLIATIFISGVSHSQQSQYKYLRKNHSLEQGYKKAIQYSRYFSGGIGFNLLNYFGDATPAEKLLKNTIKVTRPGVSAFINYNFSRSVFFKGELIYGRITGDDFNTSPYAESSSQRKYVRNLSFRNDLVGLSLIGNYNLFQDPFEYFKRRNYNIYFFTGLSIYYSNPKAKVPEQSIEGNPFENAGEWVALRPLGTEGQNHPDIGNKYSTIQVGIPLGVGVRVRLGYRLDFSAEVSVQYILSDYIDDIGTSYVDLGVFENELAKTMSDRSKEEKAVINNELRDQDIINESTQDFVYESKYDGKTYTVYKGFGHEDALRGGERQDLIAITSFKISYIFAN